MKQIINSYKYRIYPTKSQEVYLNKTFGACRFLWNIRVADFNRKVGEHFVSLANATIKQLKEIYPFLTEIPYDALSQVDHYYNIFKKQFFNKSRKVKLGRPKFKSKITLNSFGIAQREFGKYGIDFTKGIKLPKGTFIKTIFHNKFHGKLKGNVTFSKTPTGKYFVSITVEQEYHPTPSITNRSVGIDLGIKDFVILSDGTKFSNPKYFRENQSKLATQQKHLSRKTKGSNRYNKQRIKVARIHEKIANQRKYFLHNVSSHIVNNYSSIFTESLRVKNMVKNRKLSKAISDASFGMFVSMLEYKSSRQGRIFHKIDTFYPSSKICSCCGNKKEVMSLSQRTYKCDSCGAIMDRDLNASTNILNKGLSDLYSFTSGELSDYRRGDQIRPKAILPKAQSMKRLFRFID